MKSIVLPLVFAALTTLSAPLLADTAQQNKMKSCNAEAAAKKLAGDERKKFMSECLSAKPEAKAPEAKAEEKKLTPQQEKMKSCNTEAAAKKLAGDERKKFMSTCLKG